jgi:hypothetical protein
MTPLKKTLHRATQAELTPAFGPDSGRRLVVTLHPGKGNDVKDLLELRPLGTRRSETVALIDVYAWALRCRVNREVLEHARERKEAKKAQREREKISRMDRKLSRLSSVANHS